MGRCLLWMVELLLANNTTDFLRVTFFFLKEYMLCLDDARFRIACAGLSHERKGRVNVSRVDYSTVCR